MRLLLDRRAHRSVDDGVEIAASPDSRRPEPWLWDVGFHDQPHPEQCPHADHCTLTSSAGADGRDLRVHYHRSDITATADTLTISGLVHFDREAHEMVILVGVHGILGEGRRYIAPRDALVFEGDDPLHVGLNSVGDCPAVVVCVRLSRRTGKDLRWIP